MKKLVFLIISLVILISCSPSAKFLKYNEQSFEPTKEVKVLQTKPPERDYIEMGLLSIKVKKQNEDDVIIELKKKAKEIGANAIIILGEKNRGAVAVPVGNMAYGVPLKELEAIAIRYKNNR